MLLGKLYRMRETKRGGTEVNVSDGDVARISTMAWKPFVLSCLFKRSAVSHGLLSFTRCETRITLHQSTFVSQIIAIADLTRFSVRSQSIAVDAASTGLLLPKTVVEHNPFRRPIEHKKLYRQPPLLRERAVEFTAVLSVVGLQCGVRSRRLLGQSSRSSGFRDRALTHRGAASSVASSVRESTLGNSIPANPVCLHRGGKDPQRL